MIEFESVGKTYPGGAVAVESFTYTVPKHRTVVLVGSSGSGKTTLLRMVNRMVDPTSGRVLIDGVDVREADPVKLRRSIGYVLQDGGLLPHRTVADNVATVPILNGTPRREARSAALELLERVGLDPELGARYPAQLSGGQRQRVGVARALAAEPEILLMDEPFGAVDPLVRRELQRELIRIQADLAKTIVFVTHDVEEALTLGDDIILLSAGAHIAARGSGPELLAGSTDPFVTRFLGLGGDGRRLSLGGDGTVVTDKYGRAVGILDDGAPGTVAPTTGVRAARDGAARGGAASALAGRAPAGGDPGAGDAAQDPGAGEPAPAAGPGARGTATPGSRP